MLAFEQDMESVVHQSRTISLFGKRSCRPKGRTKSMGCRDLSVSTPRKGFGSTSLLSVPTKVDLHVCHVTGIEDRFFVAREPAIRQHRAFRAKPQCGRRPFVFPLISLCSGAPAFHRATFHSSTFPHTEISIPVLNAALRYCDQFPCRSSVPSLQSAHRFSSSFWETCLTSLQSAAASDAMGVLIADSNRMQAQLLASALRRRPEFHITTCPMDTISILEAITAKLPQIAVLSLSQRANVLETVMTLRRFNLSHP